MPVLYFDSETRSACDLTKCGGWRYACDPSTEVLCLAYAVDDAAPEIWFPGAAVPAPFIAAAHEPEWLHVAHNSAFDRLVTRHVLHPRHGFPLLPLDRER